MLAPPLLRHDRELKDAKVQINAWTVNRREDMEDMLRKGIDGVITNFPDLFAQVRAEFQG